MKGTVHTTIRDGEGQLTHSARYNVDDVEAAIAGAQSLQGDQTDETDLNPPAAAAKKTTGRKRAAKTAAAAEPDTPADGTPAPAPIGERDPATGARTQPAKRKRTSSKKRR